MNPLSGYSVVGAVGNVDVPATAVILGTGNIVVAAPGNIAVGTAADVVGIVVTAEKI